MRLVDLQQLARPPGLLVDRMPPAPLGLEPRPAVELVVAPGGAAAAEAEQRASQVPGAARRHQAENLAPRAVRHVVDASRTPAADAASGRKRLVGLAAGVARPQVRLAVKLGAFLGVAAQNARIEDHCSLPSGPSKCTTIAPPLSRDTMALAVSGSPCSASLRTRSLGLYCVVTSVGSIAE